METTVTFSITGPLDDEQREDLEHMVKVIITGMLHGVRQFDISDFNFEETTLEE